MSQSQLYEWIKASENNLPEGQMCIRITTNKKVSYSTGNAGVIKQYLKLSGLQTVIEWLSPVSTDWGKLEKDFYEWAVKQIVAPTPFVILEWFKKKLGSQQHSLDGASVVSLSCASGDSIGQIAYDTIRDIDLLLDQMPHGREKALDEIEKIIRSFLKEHRPLDLLYTGNELAQHILSSLNQRRDRLVLQNANHMRVDGFDLCVDLLKSLLNSSNSPERSVASKAGEGSKADNQKDIEVPTCTNNSIVEKHLFEITYFSSYGSGTHLQYSTIAKTKWEALEKFWDGKNKESFQIYNVLIKESFQAIEQGSEAGNQKAILPTH